MRQLRRVAQLLVDLEPVGCERDHAGNRELHFNDYVLLVLLYLFNPAIDSLRMLQRVSGIEQVREKLGIRRFSLGSFSESCRVFEPAMLREVVGQLYGPMACVGRREMFKDIPGLIELVDGTLLDTLASVTEAMWISGGGCNQPGERLRGGAKFAWKLHLGFEVDRHVPVSWELTDAKGVAADARGVAASDEKSVLLRRLGPGRTYVMDRGYAAFKLFNAIHAGGSNYVCRVRDNSVCQVVGELPVSQKDAGAGVISDQLVRSGTSKGVSVDHPMRLVCVKITPHDKRGRTGGGTQGPASDGVLRIATDLTGVPGHVIAFLYQHRWTLEVFIRFFKQILGCRHLLSTRRQGIEIQMAAAIIACMMINITTGRKPDKWMTRLMGFYLAGLASEQDVINELTRKDNTGVKLRAKDELWKKLGVN